MPPKQPTGPSLETYVETRFNLLIESIKEKFSAQDDSLRAFAAANDKSSLAIAAATVAAQIASDLRYQQRFEAQSDALAAAFTSQQTAMNTAFVVAEKAVQAALAAAKEAVAKAEAAADKRFEALNELRQMLNDTLKDLMTRSEVMQKFESQSLLLEASNARINALESRVNLGAGAATGEEQTKADTRANWAIAVAVIAMLLSVAVSLYHSISK